MFLRLGAVTNQFKKVHAALENNVAADLAYAAF
jgi:hypothetical protein